MNKKTDFFKLKSDPYPKYFEESEQKYNSYQYEGKFASETVIKESKILIKDRIRYQIEKYNSWYQLDNKQIGIILNKDFLLNFQKMKTPFSMQLKSPLDSYLQKEKDLISITKITINTSKDQYNFEIDKENWKELNSLCIEDFDSEQGLNLSNKILKLYPLINLRCLGLRSSLFFILKDNAKFSYLLRASENLNNQEAYIIQFFKEGHGADQRLFLGIGKLVQDKKEFLFIKKCEIPILELKTYHINNDLISIRATIIDFGTDRMTISVQVNDNKAFKLKYTDILLPSFDNFNIFVIGDGENIFIKRICLELLDRIEYEHLGGKNEAGEYARCQCLIN